jgi:hypothetical protein
VALGALSWSSCAPSGFQDERLIQSVRVLASSADQPYAAPGSMVKVQVLAFDGRSTKPEPMAVYWLPFECKNPPNDAYYACFAQFAGAARGGGAEAGAGMPGAEGGAGGLQPGVDLTPILATGPSFEFTMAPDVIATHQTPNGVPCPYGLEILFNMACAGHVELVPLDPGNVQSPPVGCFDAQHNRLGPTDYVFGVTRVYAYGSCTAGPAVGTTPTNTNPIIESIDVDGQRMTANQDGTWPPINKTRCAGNCPKIHIGPVVPVSSWEPNPAEQDANGNELHEQIWASFFSTAGSWNDGVRLLYDASSGAPGGPSTTDNQFQLPGDPIDGFIWIVVHDNRGGTAWATVPLHVM